MSLCKKIKDNEVTKDGLLFTLSRYQADRIELSRLASIGRLDPDTYKAKRRDLDMSISMVELFITKFDDIKDSPKVPRPKVR